MSPTGSVADVGVLDVGTPNHDPEGNGSLPAFLPWAIGGAWVMAVLAWINGWGAALGHDHLIEHGPGVWPALAVFLGGWQVMIAAMMLPSSITAFRWLARLTAGRGHSQRLGAAFLAGYAAVWTVFGALAFLGDIGVHRFVDRWSWLATRPWLIGGSVLVLAGAFEISPLAGRCGKRSADLRVSPGEAYRLVSSGVFRLGAYHGLRRLGRCWALMLLSFAVGSASLGWMVALTLLMVVEERTGARRAPPLTGMALLAIAGLVIAQPGWMPSLFPGAA